MDQAMFEGILLEVKRKEKISYFTEITQGTFLNFRAMM
jgi:hypothetical protein